MRADSPEHRRRSCKRIPLERQAAQKNEPASRQKLAAHLVQRSREPGQCEMLAPNFDQRPSTPLHFRRRDLELADVFRGQGVDPRRRYCKLVSAPRGRTGERAIRHWRGKREVGRCGLVHRMARNLARFEGSRESKPRGRAKANREVAQQDQWINVADAYFIPHVQPVIVEGIFRRYLGGEQNVAAMRAGREGMQIALDTADRWLAANAYFTGDEFSLADVHWMPYFEYLTETGDGEGVERRKNLSAWWKRVSARATWQRVGRTGPQPYESGMTADVVEKQYRQ